MTWNEFLSQEFEIIGGVIIHVDKVMVAGVILICTWIGVTIIRRAITRPTFISNKLDTKRRITTFLITKYIIWFASIIFSLKVIGINITALILGSTALLVGLGLGLQNIFKDLVSGLFLLFEGSIKIGDVIEADGVVGKVQEINLRSCEVMTRDDVIIIIPNSKFINEKVINWSHDSDKVRFSINVSVAYGSNIEEVYTCLEEAMLENPHVCISPLPFVQFSNFGESGLEFKMIFWSNEAFDIENIKSDIRKEVYKRLAEHNLVIPFPQRDLHIKGVEKLINKKTEEN